MHLVATLQGQASDILHGVPKGAHMMRLLGHLKTNLGPSTSPQNTTLAIVIKQLIQCAHPSLLQGHVCGEAGKGIY
jgi:hypothetical protein